MVPYCPRCGTPLSDHEVAQGYTDTEDPSVFVRFPLVDEPNTYLLVWTTTPWTLPGNVAVAAHPDVEYAFVTRADGLSDERLILAKELVEKVFGDIPVKILKTYKGKALKGKRYAPLFTFLPSDKPAHYVVNADYVTTSDGTGLVHIAPAFGADDMEVAKEYDLPVLMTINDEGVQPRGNELVWFIRERRRFFDYRGVSAARIALQGGNLHSLLSFLLALQYTAALYGTTYLVHPHQPN